MKNKLVLGIALSLLTIGGVNAEHVKYGNNNYLVQREFKCGTTEVYPVEHIEKTGKLIVCEEGYDYNTKEKCYIWNSDNTCNNITNQDILDEFNNKYIVNRFNEDEMGSCTWTNSHQETQGLYEIGLIKPTGSFDPNADYYTSEFFLGVKHVDEPNEDDFENYYLRVVLKHPDKAEIDPNQTYYTAPGHFNPVSDVIAPEDLNADDIASYYVITTYEDINYKEIKTTVGNMYYDMLRGACRVVDVIDIDGELVFKCFGTNDTLYYYDKNGAEIERFRDYHIFKQPNYYIYQSTDNKHMIVYDVNEENIIFEKTMKSDSTDMIAVYSASEDAIILNEYVDGKITSTYINMFSTLEGDKQTYTKNDLAIRFNGNYYAFKELLVNGKVVPSDKYTVTKGSTIITLKKEYLSTLEAGTYNMEVIYTDGGKGLSTFVIAEDTPATIDNIMTYTIMGILSLGGLILISKKRK